MGLLPSRLGYGKNHVPSVLAHMSFQACILKTLYQFDILGGVRPRIIENGVIPQRMCGAEKFTPAQLDQLKQPPLRKVLSIAQASTHRVMPSQWTPC